MQRHRSTHTTLHHIDRQRFLAECSLARENIESVRSTHPPPKHKLNELTLLLSHKLMHMGSSRLVRQARGRLVPSGHRGVIVAAKSTKNMGTFGNNLASLNEKCACFSRQKVKIHHHQHTTCLLVRLPPPPRARNERCVYEEVSPSKRHTVKGSN